MHENIKSKHCFQFILSRLLIISFLKKKKITNKCIYFPCFLILSAPDYIHEKCYAHIPIKTFKLAANNVKDSIAINLGALFNLPITVDKKYVKKICTWHLYALTQQKNKTSTLHKKTKHPLHSFTCQNLNTTEKASSSEEEYQWNSIHKTYRNSGPGSNTIFPI